METDPSAASRSIGSASIPPDGSSILSFRHLSYQVKTRRRGSSNSTLLIDNVSLDVRVGEILAIMGPSGSGKSTLLDLMSFRKKAMPGASVYLNENLLAKEDMLDLSMFVEQEDALIGALTVRESIEISLELYDTNLSKKEVTTRVDRVLTAMGLQSCADQRIGTFFSRGISGGQKRRVTAACALVMYPRILFLDEVTSGLDSTSALEVMIAIRELAIAERMIVLVTVHQPSFAVLSQFTDVLLLSKGRTCFYGKMMEMEDFFNDWGHPVPQFTSPADHAMSFLNDEFSAGEKTTGSTSLTMREFFLSRNTEQAAPEIFELGAVKRRHHQGGQADIVFKRTLIMAKRSFKNYSRNLLAYGVRTGIFAASGLMLATIWVQLGSSEAKINDRMAVYFFSVSFIPYMSVAGIPSFLEERAVFYRERNNGMCTTLPFVLSNTIVNLPFLFFSVTLFMVIFYWGVGLHSGAAAFFRYYGLVYLSVVAAEGEAVIIASLVPNFVAALAIASFVTGFWMSVAGFLMRARSLPRFLFFTVHHMDYQKYAFEMVAHSDLTGLIFNCDTVVNNKCICIYPSSNPEACTVSGTDVLRYLEIDTISYAKWTAILFSIAVIYRIISYFILRLLPR